MSVKELKRVLIVGGGASGWLAALFIHRRFRNKNINIVVVESTKIGTLGVGEGSTGLLTQLINDPSFGLNEAHFLRETRATFKLGIYHRDWKNIGKDCFGPIDNVAAQIPGYSSSDIQYLYAYALSRNIPIWKTHLNGVLMEVNKSPFLYHNNGVSANKTYAYHFDSNGFGTYLKRVCVQRGINHIDSKVVDIQTESDTGNIQAVILDSGEPLKADLFIDCSGLSRIMIGGHYKIPWISYKPYLPVNSALVFTLPYTLEQDIPIYTLAWAQRHGWMWQIPTQERLGCGYVYSDEFISQENAHKEVEQKLQQCIEPIRSLRFESGRYESFWIKNCVAVGLAAAFAEPLEATSIHATILQLNTLCNDYLSEHMELSDSAVSNRYNRHIARMYDDFKDFLVIHYRSSRHDSEFWKYLRSDGALNEQTREDLALWSFRLPRETDFAITSRWTSPSLYYPVLDGLGLLSKELATDELKKSGLQTQASAVYAKLFWSYSKYTEGSLQHRDALDYCMGADL
jgi:hypothetical protein